MRTTEQIRLLIAKKYYGGNFSVDWDKYNPISSIKRTYTVNSDINTEPEEGETPEVATPEIELPEDTDTWESLIRSLDLTTTATPGTEGTDSTEGTPSTEETSSAEGTPSTSRLLPSYNTWQEFRDGIYNALKEEGYDGDAAKAIVALMGLETGHGKHMAGNYNYGNITAGSNWAGNTVVKRDNQNGRNYTFRSYNTLSEGIKDYIKLALSLYGITPLDSKDTVYAKLNGENSGKRRWAEALNYVGAMNDVYKMYWG